LKNGFPFVAIAVGIFGEKEIKYIAVCDNCRQAKREYSGVPFTAAKMENAREVKAPNLYRFSLRRSWLCFV